MFHYDFNTNRDDEDRENIDPCNKSKFITKQTKINRTNTLIDISSDFITESNCLLDNDNSFNCNSPCRSVDSDDSMKSFDLTQLNLSEATRNLMIKQNNSLYNNENGNTIRSTYYKDSRLELTPQSPESIDVSFSMNQTINKNNNNELNDYDSNVSNNTLLLTPEPIHVNRKFDESIVIATPDTPEPFNNMIKYQFKSSNNNKVINFIEKIDSDSDCEDNILFSPMKSIQIINPKKKPIMTIDEWNNLPAFVQKQIGYNELSVALEDIDNHMIHSKKDKISQTDMNNIITMKFNSNLIKPIILSLIYLKRFDILVDKNNNKSYQRR